VTDGDLARLYEQYGYLVYRRCLALLGNAADAEDALQETFLRVRRYDASPSTSPLAWLYTIASNCAYDAMAKAKREQPESPEKLPRLDTRSTGGATDSDRRAVMGAVLRKLDERTRAIGVLHYLGGYTQEEVAAQTGYSRKTVGKKLKVFEDLVRKTWA
jgi:RNA polymerase sigma factor (sigma-70 family)